MFSKGDSVNTPDGIGKVAYVRMAPPEYNQPEAVSVVLESRSNDPNYSGTVYPAHNVHQIKSMKDLANDALAILNAGDLIGMVHGFARILPQLEYHLKKELGGNYSTIAFRQHPVCVLFTQAFSNVSRWYCDDNFSIAYDWALRQAAQEELVVYPPKLLPSK